MDQPKKYRVLLKPFGNEASRRELGHLQRRLVNQIRRMEAAGAVDRYVGSKLRGRRNWEGGRRRYDFFAPSSADTIGGLIQ
jgi:hypothetical protein